MTRRPKLLRSPSLVLLFLGLFISPTLAKQPSPPNKASAPDQAARATSVLLIDTDDSCRLLIDGEDKGVISPDHAQKFNLSLGDHILKCTVESVPDLVWRKVVGVKDASQVAAVITLKALHLQFDQALTKAKSQKEESDVAATKQLAEAEAAEKLRKAEIEAFPQKMFEQVKGHWSCTFTIQGTSFFYSIDFTSIEDGLIVGHFSFSSLGFSIYSGTKSKLLFKPEPGRLVGTGMTHCELARGPKGMTKPGAKKDKEGYAECAFDDRPNTATISVNESSILFDSRTFTR